MYKWMITGKYLCIHICWYKRNYIRHTVVAVGSIRWGCAVFCRVRTYIHIYIENWDSFNITYASSMIQMLTMNGYRIHFRGLLDWNIGQRNRWRCRRRAGRYRSLYRHGSRYWVAECKYLIWTITFWNMNFNYSSDRSKQILFMYWRNSWCASCRCKYFHNK